MKPDRVVIGTDSEKARKIMADLYAPFVRQGNPIYYMDARSSELTKYAANAFLATKITFMNEIANLCEKVGANVDMIRIGIGSDSRIGKRFLLPELVMVEAVSLKMFRLSLKLLKIIIIILKCSRLLWT